MECRAAGQDPRPRIRTVHLLARSLLRDLDPPTALLLSLEDFFPLLPRLARFLIFTSTSSSATPLARHPPTTSIAIAACCHLESDFAPEETRISDTALYQTPPDHRVCENPNTETSPMTTTIQMIYFNSSSHQDTL